MKKSAVNRTFTFICPKRSIFSSPKLKAHVSLSRRNLCVVYRRCWNCCCRLCCRKLFTFSFSSPEPLGQSQPNLAQNILGWRGFQYVQMKGHILFQGGDNYEIANFRIFFLRFQPNLAQSIPGWRVLKFSQIKDHF